MSAKSADPWIAVGVVARPHGVRGELRVHMYNAGSDVLVGVRELELEGKGAVAVTSARPERDAVLVRLRGCDTREAAEALKGLAVRVPRSRLPPPEPDEYYFCDLVGLAVVDPDGVDQGRVDDVREGLGHATLIVLRPDGARIDVPMADTWVKDVDITNGRIVVDDLEALGAAQT